MGKIQVLISTVREIDSKDYGAWEKGLLWAGYPAKVLEDLKKDHSAIWSQPELHVETVISAYPLHTKPNVKKDK